MYSSSTYQHESYALLTSPSLLVMQVDRGSCQTPAKQANQFACVNGWLSSCSIHVNSFYKGCVRTKGAIVACNSVFAMPNFTSNSGSHSNCFATNFPILGATCRQLCQTRCRHCTLGCPLVRTHNACAGGCSAAQCSCVACQCKPATHNMALLLCIAHRVPLTPGERALA